MIYNINISGYECRLAVGDIKSSDTPPYIYLKPAYTHDFTAEDVGERLVSDELFTLAAAWYFGSLRGYPLGEVDVLRGGRRICVPVFPSLKSYVKIKPFKYKEIYTKTTALADRVELSLFTLTNGTSRILVTECHAPDFFDSERLSSLRTHEELPPADAAYAVRISCGTADIRASHDASVRSLLLLLSYLSSQGITSADISGGRCVKMSSDFLFLPVFFVNI